MRTHLCPACGADLPVDGTRVDAERRRVERGGAAVTLPPSEFAVFHMLSAKSPRFVSRHALVHALYGARADGGPDDPPIRVFVCRLRRLLLPLGLGVETARGTGFALRVVEPSPAAPPELVRHDGGRLGGPAIGEVRRLADAGLAPEAITARLAVSRRSVDRVLAGLAPHRRGGGFKRKGPRGARAGLNRDAEATP